MGLTDLIPADIGHARRPPTVPSCQWCGINARAYPELVLNERRQCAACAAWFAAREAEGVDRRAILKAWSDRHEAAYHAAHPYELTLRLKGVAGDYYWGHFRDAGRAFVAAREAMRPIAKNAAPYGKVCVGYRIVDTRTGKSVEPDAKAA